MRQPPGNRDPRQTSRWLKRRQDGHAATASERPMRILIVTDAWRPQINGVVRTLERLAEN